MQTIIKAGCCWFLNFTKPKLNVVLILNWFEDGKMVFFVLKLEAPEEFGL